MSEIGVVIPAWNEERDLKSVLDVIGPLDWLSQIMIVDDGSTDNTLAIAQDCACKNPKMNVVRHPDNQGKGATLLTGVESLREEIDTVIFLDADLIGFTEHHLKILSDPVINQQCEMAVAGFRKGYWRTDLSQWFAPGLSGQRCLSRKSAERALLPLTDCGYGVEIGLTHYAKRNDWRVEYVIWEGATHNIKEKKLGIMQGSKIRRVMFLQLLCSLLREWWRTNREKLKPFWEFGS
jgi:glycosyltransferase involved in cell wall biosynthesis